MKVEDTNSRKVFQSRVWSFSTWLASCWHVRSMNCHLSSSLAGTRDETRAKELRHDEWRDEELLILSRGRTLLLRRPLCDTRPSEVHETAEPISKDSSSSLVSGTSEASYKFSSTKKRRTPHSPHTEMQLDTTVALTGWQAAIIRLG